MHGAATSGGHWRHGGGSGWRRCRAPALRRVCTVRRSRTPVVRAVPCGGNRINIKTDGRPNVHAAKPMPIRIMGRAHVPTAVRKQPYHVPTNRGPLSGPTNSVNAKRVTVDHHLLTCPSQDTSHLASLDIWRQLYSNFSKRWRSASQSLA